MWVNNFNSKCGSERKNWIPPMKEEEEYNKKLETLLLTDSKEGQKNKRSNGKNRGENVCYFKGSSIHAKRERIR